MALRIGKILAIPRSRVCFSAEIELELRLKSFPFCGKSDLRKRSPISMQATNESVLLPTSRDLFNGHFVEMACILVQWMHHAHAKQLVVFYYTSFLLAQEDIETC